MSVNAFAAKYLQVIAPAAIVDNAAFTTTEIDTLGWDYAEIIVNIGATDVAMAALKVQESDTSGSGFTDVTGLDMDGDTDIDGNTAALPSATDDNKLIIFQIDLRNRKRYLDLSATAGNGTNGTFASGICRLSRGAEWPSSSTEFGAETVLRV